MNSVSNENQTHLPFCATKIDAKKVHLGFDGGNLTSDAGALILREINQEIGLVEAIASELTDSRDAGKIKHTLHDLLSQRIIQIACGHEDANDSNTLRNDPIFKMITDRCPENGDALASQPTLSGTSNQ